MGEDEHDGADRATPRSPKRRVVAGETPSRAVRAEPAMAPIDLSSLTRAQSADFQQRLHDARITFRFVADRTVKVPVARADDARDILAAISDESIGDDTPFDDNPFHREFVPGLGMPAARWRRLLGAVIDWVVFAALFAVLDAPGVEPRIIWLVTGIVTVVMLSVLGATPGKLVVRTRVKDIGTARNPAPWRAAVRWGTPYAGALLAPIVPGGGILLFLGYLLSVSLVVFSTDGRALHDLFAGTVVVQQPSR